jgi:methionine aminopeptidase
MQIKEEWTAVAAEGKLSAHFEHTIITDRSPEVLTRRA